MSPGTDQRRARRVNPIVPVLVALVVAGAGVGIVAAAGRDGGGATQAVASTSTTVSTTTAPPTSTTAPPPPEPVELEAITAAPYPETVPGSYRIVYDVVENTLPRVETITVRRPYESLVVSTRNDVVISGTATSRSRLWTYLADRKGWLVLQPELHRAAFDSRPLAAMATMVAMGRATERGTGEYVGRPCRVFVTGEPLSNVGAVPASGSQSTEACIDDSGLVLHERWEIGGSVVTERTATEVTIDPEVDPASFDPTPVVEDAEEFEAILSTIAVPADQETLDDLRTDIVPPAGYELDGTVLRSGSPDRGGSAAVEVVRFYSDGVDLIELVEVEAASGVDLDGGGAVPVRIDGPETWFAPDFRASAIRSRLSDNTFVEIRGADPTLLVELLRTLTRR